MITEFALNLIKDTEKLKLYGLDNRTIKALQLRFGVIDGKEHTFKSIGNQLYSIHACYKYSSTSPPLGISGAMARVIVIKALRRIAKLSNQEIIK